MLTVQLLEKLFPTKGLNPRKFNLVRERAKLVEVMNQVLPQYGINNHKRICAFLGNCGIETDYFRTTEEYASGEDYEGRKNLGNFFKGDGRKFKGRGLTQTTGRYNYRLLNRSVGKKLGIDFCEHPEKLNEIEIAVESACIFWDDNNLNDYADRGEFKQLSGIVNRGDKNKIPLHWAKRNELYSQCKRTIPIDFFITLPLQTETVSNEPFTAKNENLNSPALQTAETPAEPKEDKVFLADYIEKNITPEEVKTTTLSFGKKLWQRAIRPLSLLYAALEAGNIYAWLGVGLAVIFAVYLIYSHRQDLKNLWQKITKKLNS